MAALTLGFVSVMKGEGGGGDGAPETQHESFLRLDFQGSNSGQALKNLGLPEACWAFM